MASTYVPPIDQTIQRHPVWYYFFFNRTHVANKDKLSLCPLMFTLSIIPRWKGNQPYAWRPLGYFPKLPQAKKFGQNIDTLHRCLDVLLSGLVMAQRSSGLTTPVLRTDGSSIELCFKVPLCFIIGDVEGHNELCARYGSHQSHRLCRKCGDCLTASSDNPLHQVKFPLRTTPGK
jgi:hypothetical protein